MRGGESDAHVRLKQLALDWARAQGFAIVAPEVRVPRSGFRADVAAMQAEPAGRTALFECKQSRADLLKDAHAEAAVRARLAELEQRQSTLEALLATHCPELRRGEAFWPEDDTWDFSCLEHRTYRRVRDELALLRRRVREGTKFARMVRYACADELYLVAEPDIFAEAELPVGWGVLVRAGDGLRLHRASDRLPVIPRQREELRSRLMLPRASRAGEVPRGEEDSLFAAG